MPPSCPGLRCRSHSRGFRHRAASGVQRRWACGHRVLVLRSPQALLLATRLLPANLTDDARTTGNTEDDSAQAAKRRMWSAAGRRRCVSPRLASATPSSILWRASAPKSRLPQPRIGGASHESRVTSHQSRFSVRSAQLGVTPCKVIFSVSHRKQTIDTLTKCHTFSCPPRAISWPVRRAFRIIFAPISPKEPRVQGR